MICFSCTHCAMKFQVKAEFAGRSTRCRTCKQPLVVPQPTAETMAFVPVDALGGTHSCLDEAGVQGGVTIGAAKAAADHESVGKMLAQKTQVGRYVVEKEIARGGMGAVLRAIDRDLRREVAVKYMLNADNAHQKARFIEEAQITGQLEHPHIVPIHELGIDGQKRLFFSMKMVQGRSVADIHKDLRDQPDAGKQWPLHRLINILINVCNAIAYAHSRSVIHRDLKPANIMVGEFGEVYVMDWGLAKVLRPQPVPLVMPLIIDRPNAVAAIPVAEYATPSDIRAPSSTSKVHTSRDTDGELTQDGSVMGTPVYMPPEQALGRINDIDQRSDVYALGAILYEMLTLQPPVDKQGGQMAILQRVIDGAIMSPAERAPKLAQRGLIPPELAALAMKALARDPKSRYPSAEALRQDLERFQEGKSVSAKLDTKREMFIKFVKRNKEFSAATAAGLAVLAVVLAIAFWINIGARVHAQNQQAKAESALTALDQEQKEKEKSIQRSLPAFLAVAQQQAADGKIDDAANNLNVVLTYDPKHAGARLLKSQIHLARQQWPAAQSELKAYLRQQPKDAQAHSLLQLCKKDKDAATLHALVVLLQEQNLNGLATPLLQEVQKTVNDRKPLFETHRKQIAHFYPGADFRLEANGQVVLILSTAKGVSDLTPLTGMPINEFVLSNAAITSIAPLKGMPLVKLNLSACVSLHDLEPLRGMRTLRHLILLNNPLIQDISAFKGMPLSHLNLSGEVLDFSPLQGMPLTELTLYSSKHLRDLEPLKDMPLEFLNLSYSHEIRDLRPLKGMPLKTLNLTHTSIENLAPLRGMPLTTLTLAGCGRLTSLAGLENMPLVSLDLMQTQVRDLGPLKGAPLASLNLVLAPVSDLAPLRNLPLKSLNLEHTEVRNVSPLQGMSLKEIDLDPKKIDKGMEVLRAMKTLETIRANELNYAPDDFWRRYDKGEFKK